MNKIICFFIGTALFLSTANAQKYKIMKLPLDYVNPTETSKNHDIEDNSGRKDKERYWLVFSDRSNNQTFEKDLKTPFIRLSNSIKYYVVEAKTGWLHIVSATRILENSIPEGAYDCGWIRKENVLFSLKKTMGGRATNNKKEMILESIPKFRANVTEWFVNFNTSGTKITNAKIDYLDARYPFELTPNIGIGREINFGRSIRKLSISAGMGVITNSFTLNQKTNFVYHKTPLSPIGDSIIRTVILKRISSQLTSNILQFPISFGYRLFRSNDEKFSIQGRATLMPAIALKSRESNLSGSVEYRTWIIGASVDTIKNYPHDGINTVHPINLSKTEAKFDRTISFSTSVGIELKYTFSSKMSINFSPSYMIGFTPFLKIKNESTDLLPNGIKEAKKGVMPFTLKGITASGICLKLGLEYSF